MNSNWNFLHSQPHARKIGSSCKLVSKDSFILKTSLVKILTCFWILYRLLMKVVFYFGNAHGWEYLVFLHFYYDVVNFCTIHDKKDSLIFMILPIAIKAVNWRPGQKKPLQQSNKRCKVESEESKREKIKIRETFIVHVDVSVHKYILLVVFIIILDTWCIDNLIIIISYAKYHVLHFNTVCRTKQNVTGTLPKNCH